MNFSQPQSTKMPRGRLRCYSSMNYNQYEDFFGTPPRMPQAPNTKPQQDPIDIPFLSLQTEATEQQELTERKVQTKLIYNMEVIPQVDSSDANSIGFHSPHAKLDFFKFNAASRMEDESEDMNQPTPVKRSRSRPRSFSENNAFVSKSRIIDFLSEFKNKGRKQVKLQ